MSACVTDKQGKWHTSKWVQLPERRSCSKDISVFELRAWGCACVCAVSAFFLLLVRLVLEPFEGSAVAAGTLVSALILDRLTLVFLVVVDRLWISESITVTLVDRLGGMESRTRCFAWSPELIGFWNSFAWVWKLMPMGLFDTSFEKNGPGTWHRDNNKKGILWALFNLRQQTSMRQAKWQNFLLLRNISENLSSNRILAK